MFLNNGFPEFRLKPKMIRDGYVYIEALSVPAEHRGSTQKMEEK